MLSEYKGLVDSQLQKIIKDNPNLPIYEPIKYIVELGGKRFRSSLALLSADIFCGKPLKAINEAGAIELFHNFTLIHDDIMDEAPVRRGQSAVHKKWDTNIAILSGDLLYALVNKILASSPVQSSEVHLLFQQTALEVCEGQSLDMAYETQQIVSQTDYLEMIKLKTAVLVGCALKIGAIIGGASKKNAQLLYDFGVNLGIAFQIHDDILDVFPTKEVFGKQIGGDILEKKKTILLIDLLEKLTNDEKAGLYEIIETDELSDSFKVDKIKEMYKMKNVLQTAEDKKSFYFTKALQNIKALQIDLSRKKQLNEFAENLMNRKY
mgnify:CR=1 FL=1